jgi:hypothetical protein
MTIFISPYGACLLQLRELQFALSTSCENFGRLHRAGSGEIRAALAKTLREGRQADGVTIAGCHLQQPAQLPVLCDKEVL